MDKTLRDVIIVSLLMISLSAGYYFVIYLPQKGDALLEQTRAKNATMLKTCLDDADENLRANFYVLCVDNKQISGGDHDNCKLGSIGDVIGYMNLKLNTIPAKNLLKQREVERNECFKIYSGL